MQRAVPNHATNLSTPYRPCAIYYEQADSVEYVRDDKPSIARRIDGSLTLIYDMDHRSRLIGFRLNGFKNFYLSDLTGTGDFVSLVGALERALTSACNNAFEAHERRDAYNKARELAVEDRVILRDLPAKVGIGIG